MASDKIESGYWDRYLERLAGLEVHSILELGVLHGESLDLWRALWPDADVVGIDRDPPTGTAWTTYLADQDDAESLALITGMHGGWDVVVDDCEHVGAKTLASFEALWPRTRLCYVIEDWGTGYWPGWADHGSGHTMVDVVKGLVDGITGNGAATGDRGIARMEFLPGQVFVWR